MPFALYFLLSVNLLTFAMFGWDKRAARRQKRRIPEARLYFFTLLGGGIGAWIAIRVFRHKTVKTSFRIRLFASAVMSLGLWWGLYKLLWDK
ncbi:MAG: DUF1294 domain-containing protein [Planctomycetes bacterium]|nr:DUF1294 domain-containing protein [Planctomycetota bacterium]